MIRMDRFGDSVDRLADRLRVAPGDWMGYESVSDSVPIGVLLRFVELTGAEPLWLLRGQEPRYRSFSRADSP